MTGDTPLISVVIPVYNGSKYLQQAIESVFNQTHPPFEVIVVNDGSNDEGASEAIAKSYGDKIRYFSKPNGGVSTAINFGIRKMKGDWFCWLSHDDVFAKERIAKDVEIINMHPEAKVVFCRVNKIDNNGKLIETVHYPIENVTSPRDVLILRGVDMCSLTIHRKCFDTVGLFNETNRTTQDTELSLRLATAYRFYSNPIVGVSIREHPDRVFYRLHSEHLNDQLKIAQVIHDDLTIEAFYPGFIDKSQETQSNAWIWMGSQYLSFGARNYAEEAFRNALSICPSLFAKTRASLKIASIWTAKTLLSRKLRSQLKSLWEPKSHD